MHHSLTKVTVLAVGNPIMADDGIGLELLSRVRAACPWANAEWIDGGTGGMELLPIIQDAHHLLVLDAVAGTTPGHVVTLVGDQIPRMRSSKLSPHQVGLLDLFSAARLLGNEPDEVVVVGVVPHVVELRLGLSQSVEAALPQAVAAAVDVLQSWLCDSSSKR